MMANQLRALILAAGLGTRLQPFTEWLPKPLFPVAGVPLIDFAMHSVVTSGVRSVAVNTFHHSFLMSRHLSTVGSGGVPVHCLVEMQLAGTGGILRYLEGLWGDDDLLVITSDIITDLNIKEFWRNHRESGASVSVAAVEHSWPLVEWGGDVAVVDDSGFVEQYQIAPLSNAGSRIACTGAYILSPSARRFMPPEDVFEINSDLCVRASAERALNAYVADYEFFDFGTPERLVYGAGMLLTGELGLRAEEALRRHSPGELVEGEAIRDGARLQGPVYIGPGVALGKGCTVIGPTVLEAGVTVEADCLLSGSVVLPGARVRSGTVLASACLGETVPFMEWVERAWAD